VIVLHFDIRLRDINPPIWRSLQVPGNYTFWDLHVAIQDVMGWTDYHLHEFFLGDPDSNDEIRIGIPDGEGWEGDPLPGWGELLAPYLIDEAFHPFRYLYDFGDNWVHDVKFLGVYRLRGEGQPLRCLFGARACPPEDCGGTAAYEEMVTGVHEFQEEYAEFDPEAFDSGAVSFTDPIERWEIAFGEEE
jgi:hypothetical protein